MYKTKCDKAENHLHLVFRIRMHTTRMMTAQMINAEPTPATTPIMMLVLSDPEQIPNKMNIDN